MNIAEGSVAYRLGCAPCSALGLTWSANDLEKAIRGPLANALFDEEGTTSIESILAGLADTAFMQSELRRILTPAEDLENWRVGEVIAEEYLTKHRLCYFPWRVRRDHRKSGSSLPGADLVGFGTDEKGCCFSFGEVKTSSEAAYPPGAMYGRTGLKRQLEDLRNSNHLRDDLLKYLGYRAALAPWKSFFQAASRRYLNNSSDVILFGVLIRDVPPHPSDLRARIQSLNSECPDGTRVELLALYLPAGSIPGLANAVLSTRTRP